MQFSLELPRFLTYMPSMLLATHQVTERLVKASNAGSLPFHGMPLLHSLRAVPLYTSGVLGGTGCDQITRE
jgi:hypothetical protein